MEEENAKVGKDLNEWKKLRRFEKIKILRETAPWKRKKSENLQPKCPNTPPSTKTKNPSKKLQSSISEIPHHPPNNLFQESEVQHTRLRQTVGDGSLADPETNGQTDEPTGATVRRTHKPRYGKDDINGQSLKYLTSEEYAPEDNPKLTKREESEKMATELLNMILSDFIFSENQTHSACFSDSVTNPKIDRKRLFGVTIPVDKLDNETLEDRILPTQTQKKQEQENSFKEMGLLTGAVPKIYKDRESDPPHYWNIFNSTKRKKK